MSDTEKTDKPLELRQFISRLRYVWAVRWDGTEAARWQMVQLAGKEGAQVVFEPGAAGCTIHLMGGGKRHVPAPRDGGAWVVLDGGVISVMAEATFARDYRSPPAMPPTCGFPGCPGPSCRAATCPAMAETNVSRETTPENYAASGVYEDVSKNVRKMRKPKRGEWWKRQPPKSG